MAIGTDNIYFSGSINEVGFTLLIGFRHKMSDINPSYEQRIPSELGLDYIKRRK